MPDLEQENQLDNPQEKKRDNKKESTSSHILRFVIIIVLLAAVVLTLYFRLTNQSRNSDRQAEENYSETEVLKHYDLEKQFPKAAREVVKLHCRYLKCIYNEDLEQGELRVLNQQTRMLYANDLLTDNTESEQFADLLEDVASFQSAGKRFISYVVTDESNVGYTTVDGIEYAMVAVTCYIREGSTTNAWEEEYVLMKEDGQWKILGWQGIDLDELTE